MTNFLEYLWKERGDSSSATIEFLRSLRNQGIYVSPRAITRAIILKKPGESTEDIRHELKFDIDPQEHTDKLLARFDNMGYEIDCTPLIDVPKIFSRHIDHEKTLSYIRKNYSSRRGVVSNTIEESRIYLNHLQTGGISLNRDELHLSLPKEHLDVLKNLENAVGLAIDYNIVVPRCKPGWTNAHDQYSRFRFANNWIDDPRRKLETRLLGKNATITDSVCGQCFDELME